MTHADIQSLRPQNSARRSEAGFNHALFGPGNPSPYASEATNTLVSIAIDSYYAVRDAKGRYPTAKTDGLGKLLRANSKRIVFTSVAGAMISELYSTATPDMLRTFGEVTLRSAIGQFELAAKAGDTASQRHHQDLAVGHLDLAYYSNVSAAEQLGRKVLYGLPFVPFGGMRERAAAAHGNACTAALLTAMVYRDRGHAGANDMQLWLSRAEAQFDAYIENLSSRASYPYDTATERWEDQKVTAGLLRRLCPSRLLGPPLLLVRGETIGGRRMRQAHSADTLWTERQRFNGIRAHMTLPPTARQKWWSTML